MSSPRAAVLRGKDSFSYLFGRPLLFRFFKKFCPLSHTINTSPLFQYVKLWVNQIVISHVSFPSDSKGSLTILAPLNNPQNHGVPLVWINMATISVIKGSMEIVIVENVQCLSKDISHEVVSLSILDPSGKIQTQKETQACRKIQRPTVRIFHP